VEEERRRGLLDAHGQPRLGPDFLWDLRTDTASGMIASQFVSWCIIIVGATVLHANGTTTVTSAAGAAKALLPLVHGFPHAGLLAELLFAVGIVGLGLLAVPVLAASSAYAVSEVSGWPEGLNMKLDKAQGFYAVIVLGMAIGLLNNFVGFIDPIKMLVVAAVINGAVAAPIIAVVALLATNKKVMGQYRSGWLSNTFVWLACLGMAAAAVGLLISTL
jgi:Mn2+/Fe2+ NRAMP family transporter